MIPTDAQGMTDLDLLAHALIVFFAAAMALRFAMPAYMARLRAEGSARLRGARLALGSLGLVLLLSALYVSCRWALVPTLGPSPP